MKIIVNGAEEERDCASLFDLWELRRIEQEITSPVGFAIALNGRLVRRDEWSRTPLSPGDRVEIVRAFAGG